jgi:hypothetical protein
MCYLRCIGEYSMSGKELVNDDLEEPTTESIHSFKSENSFFFATWTWYRQYYLVSCVSFP